MSQTDLFSAFQSNVYVSQILRILEPVFSSGQWNSMVLFWSFVNIFAIMAIKSILDKNIDYWALFTRHFSKVKSLVKKTTVDKDYFLKKYKRKVIFLRGFPLILRGKKLWHFPLLHSDFVGNIPTPGNKTYYFTINENDDNREHIILTPQVLFPSKNYKELERLLEKRLGVSKILGFFEPITICINGCPGLGKTKFADYIASKKLFSSVGLIDMAKMMTFPFEKVVAETTNIFSSETVSLVVVDEIDKYLDHKLKVDYRALKDKSQETFETYRAVHKEAFLYKLLSVMEGDTSKKIVFIYCCNNFDTLFEEIDRTHFNSLVSRFIFHQFQPCDRTEIQNYITWINDKFKNTPYYCDFDPEVLAFDSTITYREMSQLMFKAEYNTTEFFRLLSEPKPNLELSESRPKPANESVIESAKSLIVAAPIGKGAETQKKEILPESDGEGVEEESEEDSEADWENAKNPTLEERPGFESTLIETGDPPTDFNRRIRKLLKDHEAGLGIATKVRSTQKLFNYSLSKNIMYTNPKYFHFRKSVIEKLDELERGNKDDFPRGYFERMRKIHEANMEKYKPP